MPDCGMREANARTIPAAAHRSLRALRLESLTSNLMNYFAALGAQQGHVFTLRDINLQVMMNVFAPDERALLDVVLARLVAEGDLSRVSEPGYVLTDQGLNRVRLMTRARWSVSNAGRPVHHDQ